MAQTDKPTVETTYPLSVHLKELRKRVMYAGLVVILLFVLCYWQSAYIFDFVTRPITPFLNEKANLTMLAITEAFITELKMSFLAALAVGMPFILYQFWKFVAPGLYKQERRYLVGFVLSATVLFLSGAAFVYIVVFPLGMKFLLAVGMKMDITATLSVSWYLTFVLKLMIAFGTVFELPVVVFFLAKIGIVNAEMLRKFRKFAIIGIFILAAVLTPPDVISQVAMAIPLLLLYEISIHIAKAVAPKKPKEEAVAADIYQ